MAGFFRSWQFTSSRSLRSPARRANVAIASTSAIAGLRNNALTHTRLNEHRIANMPAGMIGNVRISTTQAMLEQQMKLHNKMSTLKPSLVRVLLPYTRQSAITICISYWCTHATTGDKEALASQASKQARCAGPLST